MRIDLKNTTFIVPIYIESDDRMANFAIMISYLCTHLDTNVIILEHDESSKIKQFLSSFDSNGTNIKHVFSENTGDKIFHRTKFLNMMLSMVRTPVVVNYDTDILLDPDAYKIYSDLILNDGFDLVYPYFWGQSQYQVNYAGRDKIQRGVMPSELAPTDYTLNKSEYGHCQFFNTTSYISGGMENEGFVSYAPEDQERGYRFKKLGYKVAWGSSYVYHMEHTRGINSTSNNPKMSENMALFDYIKSLTKDQLSDYYDNIDYKKKYV